MSKVRKITFRRKVPIQTWDLRLTIQKYEEHPVWLAILKLAQENSGRTSAKMVHEKLLVGRVPILNAKLLLKRVVNEGLLNDQYRLTKDGRDALDKELIPIGMSGLFTTDFVDDLLIPQIVLSVSEPHNPRVDGKSLKRNGPARKEIERAQEVPDFIREVIDKPILVNKESQHIVIKDVEVYGTPQKNSQSDLILQFTSKDQINLQIGSPIDRKLTLPERLNLTFAKTLDILLSGFGRDWKRDEKNIIVTFEETNPTERRNFKKSFSISNPNIPGFGVFETVTIPPVRIEPKTQTDAQAWFDWLLIDQLPNKYLRQSMFREHVSKTRAKIPARFEIEEPDQESLAQELFRTGDTVKAWLLQAPIDLLHGDVK